MADDLARLGLQFVAEGADQTNRALDTYEKKAGSAEKATDGFVASQGRTKGAAAQMQAEVLRAAQAMDAAAAAQRAATMGSEALANQQRAAALATSVANGELIKHVNALNGVVSYTPAILRAAQAQQTLATDTAKAGRQAQVAAVHFDTLHDEMQRDFVGQYVAGMNRVETVTTKATASSRKATIAALDLSRQFADVGVTAAMGMNPLMIMVQQGPQIADRLAMMKMEGVGLSTALRSMSAAAAPVLLALAPIAAAAILAAGAFGLFERAVDKNTKHATTWGDTWKATVKVVGAAIMQGPIGDALKWLGNEFTRTLDLITKVTFDTFTRVTAFITASYKTIVANWNNLPGAFEAIFVSAANAAIKATAWLVNGNIKLFNKLIEGWNSLGPMKAPTIAEIDFDGMLLKAGGRAEKASADLDKFYKQDLAAYQKAGHDFVNAVAAQADKEWEARQKAKKGAKDHAKALKDVETAYEKAKKEIDEYLETMRREQATSGMSAEQVKIMDAQAMAAKAIAIGYDYAAAAILRYADALMLAEGAQKAWNAEMVRTPADLADGVKGIETATDRARNLADAFADVRYSLRDLVRSMKSGDIGGFLLNIQGMVSGIGNLLGQGAAGALSLGSIAANTIGGKTGRAIGGGLGIAGAGIAAGSSLMTAASMGMLGSGAMAGMAMTLAPILGPLAIAAGALYAAAKIFNIGGKPTNAGAGYDLRDGRISGDKRTEETEGAARSAGEAIQGIMDAVKAAGIGLTDAVTGLVIGTRDQTQIYLQSGKTLLSAVGDSGAAVDTAMRALLESATYVTEAQKKLVDSALAAGKGFDAIAEILATYEAAQNISKGLADEILKLTDPKAYDIAAVKREIEAQRKGAKEMAEAGYLTAEQLTLINSQLATLEQLRLDEVMKNYADAVDDASRAVEDARDALTRAYEAEASALEDTISKFTDLSRSLRDFGKSLVTGPAAMLSPEAQYTATRTAFEQTAAKARLGDADALGDLQGVSQAYLDASKAYYASSGRYFADLAQVKAAVQASEATASRTASNATQQLDVLKAQVSGLITINESVLSVHDAIVALQAAMGLAPAATPPAFASGGSFTVGGAGPQNFGPVTLHGGETANISRADTMAAVVSELKTANTRLASLERKLAQHGEATVASNENAGKRIERAVAKPSTERLVSGGRA